MSEFQEIDSSAGSAYEIVQGRLRSLGRVSTEFLTDDNTVGLLELAQMLVAVEIATDDLDNVPEPDMEYSQTQPDGKQSHIRIWEDRFDLNGFIVNDAVKWAVGRDRHATLKLLVENAGQPLTMDDVLSAPNFLPELKDSSKRLYFYTAFSALSAMDEAAGLLQTGRIPGQRLKKWYGVGVEAAAVEELGKRLLLTKQQSDIGNRALDEIVNPELDATFSAEQDSKPQGSPRPERTAAEYSPEEEPSEESLDLQKLFSLAKAKPEFNEMLRYIAIRGETELMLADLATEATSREIPVRQYETKIIPALNNTARQLGINIKFVLKRNFRKDGSGEPFLSVQIFS